MVNTSLLDALAADLDTHARIIVLAVGIGVCGWRTTAVLTALNKRGMLGADYVCAELSN